MAQRGADQDGRDVPPRPRMLIVDDDPHAGRALARALGQEFEVRLVAGAAEALALLGAEAFDAVLTDLDMPGMTGFALLAHVRERWPKVRRVLMSGASWPDAGTGPDAIVEAFFEKPPDLERLRRRLRAHAV